MPYLHVARTVEHGCGNSLFYPRNDHRLTGSFLRKVVVILILTVTAGCQPITHPIVHPLLSGNLPITAPGAITAGDPVRVEVGPVNVMDGTLVGLMMVGNYGPHIYRSTFENGVAKFMIPGEHTLQSGSLALIAASESARGEAGVLLRPESGARQQVADRLTSLVDIAIRQQDFWQAG